MLTQIMCLRKIMFCKIVVRRFTLFYIFASLYEVWLNRKQLGSLICFCLQSGAYEKRLATHNYAFENSEIT